MSVTKKNPTTIADLEPDMQNANKHTEHGMGLLKKSMINNGAGRSILISNDNVVIAGNGTLEVAGSIGLENVRVIETNGSELIAVKRTDIESGSDEFVQLALADNIVAKKNIVMDVDVIDVLAEQYKGIEEWKTEAIDIGKGKKNYEKDLNKKTRYVVEVTLSSEAKQTKLFNKLNSEGYDCRVVTL